MHLPAAVGSVTCCSVRGIGVAVACTGDYLAHAAALQCIVMVDSLM